ncbi:MAG: hypothetical protein DRI77_01790, partial [Chloroflexi bacterium]
PISFQQLVWIGLKYLLLFSHNRETIPDKFNLTKVLVKHKEMVYHDWTKQVGKCSALPQGGQGEI